MYPFSFCVNKRYFSRHSNFCANLRHYPHIFPVSVFWRVAPKGLAIGLGYCLFYLDAISLGLAWGKRSWLKVRLNRARSENITGNVVGRIDVHGHTRDPVHQALLYTRGRASLRFTPRASRYSCCGCTIPRRTSVHAGGEQAGPARAAPAEQSVAVAVDGKIEAVEANVGLYKYPFCFCFSFFCYLFLASMLNFSICSSDLLLFGAYASTNALFFCCKVRQLRSSDGRSCSAWTGKDRPAPCCPSSAPFPLLFARVWLILASAFGDAPFRLNCYLTCQKRGHSPKVVVGILLLISYVCPCCSKKTTRCGSWAPYIVAFWRICTKKSNICSFVPSICSISASFRSSTALFSICSW